MHYIWLFYLAALRYFCFILAVIHFHYNLHKSRYNFIYLALSQSEDSSLSSVMDIFHHYFLKYCFFHHPFLFSSWNLHCACVFLSLSPLQLFFYSWYQYPRAVFWMNYSRLFSNSQVLYSNVSRFHFILSIEDRSYPTIINSSNYFSF